MPNTTPIRSNEVKVQRIFHKSGKRTGNFTMIDNAPVNSAKLTMRAKGLLVYLLSKPPDWIVRIRDIRNHFCNSTEYEVKSALKELDGADHARLLPAPNDERGRVSGCYWTIYEDPADAPKRPANHRAREIQRPGATVPPESHRAREIRRPGADVTQGNSPGRRFTGPRFFDPLSNTDLNSNTKNGSKASLTDKKDLIGKTGALRVQNNPPVLESSKERKVASKEFPSRAELEAYCVEKEYDPRLALAFERLHSGHTSFAYGWQLSMDSVALKLPNQIIGRIYTWEQYQKRKHALNLKNSSEPMASYSLDYSDYLKIQDLTDVVGSDPYTT